MNRQLKLLLGLASFFVFAAGMFGPIYALYVKDIGGDILDTGIAWSIFMIVSGIGMFFMGKVHDRIKKEKSIMLMGYALRAIVFLSYIYINSIAQLYFIQLLLGLSLIMTIPAYDSLYTKNLEKGKFASQWAAFESMYFTVQGVAAILGALIVTIFSFTALFIVMFIFSLIGLGLATQIQEKK